MQKKLENAAAALAAACIPYTQNQPLKQYTSFKIGGPATLFASPADAGQVAQALAIAKQNQVPYFLLGCGSNVLFLDEGYAGMVIHIGEGLAQIQISGDRITAQAGSKLMDVCTAARKAGLTGLEFAFGIPGSIGGAVYMNAGAYGGEICDVLEAVTYIDEAGEMQTAGAESLGLGYRESVFQQKPWCVVSATLRLKHGDSAQIAAEMRDIMARRADKQPLEYPSAGSAFKRPPGAFAGALIDDCGLRGYRVGDAAISEKHCGFIVNLGDASCRDVLALAAQVSERVKQQTGYDLEKEIRVIEAGK